MKIKYLVTCAVLLVISGCTNNLAKLPGSNPQYGITLTESPHPTITPTPEPAQAPNLHRGYYEDIPQSIREQMRGVSMPAGATVSYDDLAYLTVYHMDFNGQEAVGHIVVAKELADEVLDIFMELYEIEYPIESVRLIDDFNNKQTAELNSLDRASMGNNNTSAFCYRVINGSGNMSQHAYGRAIDLNPKINPYVTGSVVSPKNAVKYADRNGVSFSEVETRAMIHKDDAVYKIFTSRGWKWGCEIWDGIYDYQHFQKEM